MVQLTGRYFFGIPPFEMARHPNIAFENIPLKICLPPL